MLSGYELYPRWVPLNFVSQTLVQEEERENYKMIKGQSL